MNMLKRVLFSSLILLHCLVFTGCGSLFLRGIVYTHLKLPLTTDLNNTPAGTAVKGRGRVLEIKEPFSGYGFYAKVDSNSFGDIAKKNKMKKIYYADQEIFSILGIWTSTTIHLHGE